MIAVIAVLLAAIVAAVIAFNMAVARNGPAVLDMVDRIAGGGATTGVTRMAEVRYGSDPAQKLFVHRVEQFEPDGRRPVIVFFHGGSWRSGDPQYYDFVGRNLAARGAIVVNAGYRLRQSGRWPAMMEDSAAAVAWVMQNIGDLGGDTDRVFLMGHSAGAYNVAMLGLDPQWLAADGVETGAIRGIIGVSGPYDFYPFDSDSTIAAFGDSEDPRATQPIALVRGDAPPMLLLHGAEDTLVEPRNSVDLARAIVADGGRARSIVYPAMDHNAPLIALAHPWIGRRAIADTVMEFVAAPDASVPVQGKNR